MSGKPLIVVVGPTASGKSDLAMQLAKDYDGELICADSRTVYKGMDIGTAKPSARDQSEVPHHLLDIVEPGVTFSAAQFKYLAMNAIDDVLARGKLPIMVGGTGLYIDSVLFDLQFGEAADPILRAKLNKLDIEDLQETCKNSNITLPENSKNKRHLVRAIELGGLKNHKKVMRPDTLVVGITTNREQLQERIKNRSYIMVEQGIIEEVASLGRKYGWNNEAMKGNIYRIFKGVVDGAKPLPIALEEFIYSDLHLAKRQLTWFKRNPAIVWGSSVQLKSVVQNFLTDYDYVSHGSSLLQ